MKQEPTYIFRDVQQNTDEWYQLRTGKVTASKYPVIMAHDGKAFGDPAKDYALQLALEKINGVRIESSYTNEDMERGHIQEPVARMLYEQKNFVVVENGGFFDWGTHGVSPDGLVGSGGVIEIKSVIPKTHYATMVRGGPDPTYTWQLVGHLEGTGRDWVDFVSYCPQFPENRRLLTYRLHRDQVSDLIVRLRARRDAFLELVNTKMLTIIEGKETYNDSQQGNTDRISGA